MTNASIQRAGIALLIGLSLFFRFYNLEEKLLWHDELATRVFAAGYTVDEWHEALFTGEIFDVSEVTKYQHHNPQRSVMAAIRGLAEDDPQHPPLYYVLTRVWVSVFGDSIATLRALSVLFSLLGFPAIFWLACEMFDDKRTAWMSVLLYGVSPFFILYAQEAREYALWAVLILVSNASLLMAIKKGTARSWALYSLITVVSLYTSFTTASVIITQLIYLVVRERLRPTEVAKKSFVALAVSAICFVPWVITLLDHWDAFQVSMKWSKIINIPNSALLRILGHNFSRTIVDFWVEIVDPMGWAVMLAACAVIAVASAHSARKHLLLALAIAVPIGMLLIPDLAFGGIRSISMRYLTPSWLAVLLALAHWMSTQRVAAVVVLAVCTISSATNAPKIAVWTKATSFHLPEVADIVNAASEPLVVGNMERHNPGNLMALSARLKPGTKMQFLDTKAEEHYVLPRQFGTVFLYSPIGDYRKAMEQREGVTSEILIEDHFLDLWRIQ